jgi:hypothetical protein
MMKQLGFKNKGIIVLIIYKDLIDRELILL